LYDQKLTKLIQDSSNGADLLTQEIKNSEGRLKAVKKGISISDVMPNQDPSFYVPDVESYFKGQDRIKRKKGCVDEVTDQVKFFITETNLVKTE
jgi:hypothetical protein